MEVRVAKEANKIRISNDEMIVKINGRESVRHTPLNLKAKFEESISLIRAMEKPPKHVKGRKTVFPVPSCPVLNQHPILQTLLKIVWEGFVGKFNILTQTFRATIQERVASTKKLRDFEAVLSKSENEIISNIRANVRDEPDNKEEIEEALGKKGTVDELIEYAIERGVASTGEDRSFFSVSVLPSLGGFQAETEYLWAEWKLQVERHKCVFKGKLDQLSRIDDEIAKIKERPVVEEEKADENDGIAMYSQMYKAIIEQLSEIKVRKEIQNAALDKYEKYLRERMNVAKQKAYANIRSEIIALESTEIAKATSDLKLKLDKIKAEQDRALHEIKVAGANVDQIVKTMQISIDLTLESAREFLYTEGLDALTAFSGKE